MSILFSSNASSTVANSEYTIESNFALSKDGSNVYFIINQNNNTYLIDRNNNIGNITKYPLSYFCYICYLNLQVSNENDKVFFLPGGSNEIYIFDLKNENLTNIPINYDLNHKVMNDTYYQYFFSFSNDTTNLSIQPVQNVYSIWPTTFVLPNGINSSMNGLYGFRFFSNFTSLIVYLRSNTEFFVNYYKINKEGKYLIYGSTYYNATLLSSKEYQFYNDTTLNYSLFPFQQIRLSQNNSIVYYSFYNNRNTTIYSFNLQNVQTKTIATFKGNNKIETVGPQNSYIVIAPNYSEVLLDIYTFQNLNWVLKQSVKVFRFDNWDSSGEYGIILQNYNSFLSIDQSNPVVSLIHYDSTKNVIDEKIVTDQFSLNNESSFFSALTDASIFIGFLFLCAVIVLFYHIERQNEIGYY